MAINLLPWRENLLKRKKWYFWLAVLLMLILLLAIAGTGRYYLIYLNRGYQFRTVHLIELIQANPLPDDEKSLLIDFEHTKQQVKLIQSVDQAQKRFWQELDLLQKSSQSIQFNHLTWTPGELKIEGYSTQAGLIGPFIKNLENSELFSHISLGNLNQDDKTGAINFILDSTHQENTP